MNINNVDFADEIPVGFCYKSIEKKISIDFESFIYSNEIVSKPVSLEISLWSKAQSRNCSDTKFVELENHLGIPSLILSSEFCDEFFSLVINTVDNRYIELKFYKAQVKLVENIIS
jgi:hypothetical protein